MIWMFNLELLLLKKKQKNSHSLVDVCFGVLYQLVHTFGHYNNRQFIREKLCNVSLLIFLHITGFHTGREGGVARILIIESVINTWALKLKSVSSSMFTQSLSNLSNLTREAQVLPG